MTHLIPERSYLIPDVDLNEEVRRMNAERLAEWQNSAKTDPPMVIGSKPLKIEKLEEKVSNHQEISRYIEMPVINGYGKALEQLRKACSEDHNSQQQKIEGLVRPLSLRETMIARLNQPELWNRYFDTITGVAYSQEDQNKFKIDPVCSVLNLIPPNFNQAFLPTNFAASPGTELKKNGDLYNQLLIKRQFLAPHQGWYAALEEDVDLMKEIAKIRYKERETAFGFYLMNNVGVDQWRAVCAYYVSIYSSAGINLYYDMRFLRVAHV